jgi:hypothetical protein
LVTFSEQFDNAAWTKVGLTISANSAISPDGTTTADKIIIDNGTAFSSVSTYCRTSALTLTTGIVYNISVYAKPDGFDRMSVRMATAATMGAGPTISVVIDLITGLQTGGTIGTYIGRTPAANGYFRYLIQTASIASATNYLAFSVNDSVATEGNGVGGISIWGAQLEAGSYTTTYIPTTTAAVTRLADACSLTGASSIIGQTEGTLFLDFESGALDSLDNVFGVNNGTTSSRIVLFKTSTNTISAQVRDAGSFLVGISTSTITPNTRYKCAMAYKLNDVVLYVNGSLIGTDTSTTIPACSVLAFDAGGLAPMNRPVNQAALYTTRLPDPELQSLTTL